jgi:hypothetical protein
MYETYHDQHIKHRHATNEILIATWTWYMKHYSDNIYETSETWHNQHMKHSKSIT